MEHFAAMNNPRPVDPRSGNPFARRVQWDGIFVTGEQMRYFARKRGLEAVAAWAAECMGFSAGDATRYEQEIAAAFRENSLETRLLNQIQTDLERAGKPALSIYAGTVFANAVEEAQSDLECHAARQQAIALPASRSRNPSDQRTP